MRSAQSSVSSPFIQKNAHYSSKCRCFATSLPSYLMCWLACSLTRLRHSTCKYCQKIALGASQRKSRHRFSARHLLLGLRPTAEAPKRDLLKKNRNDDASLRLKNQHALHAPLMLQSAQSAHGRHSSYLLRTPRHPREITEKGKSERPFYKTRCEDCTFVHVNCQRQQLNPSPTFDN